MRTFSVSRICCNSLVPALMSTAVLLGASAPAQAATVDVQFLPPEQYTDVGFHEVPANDALGELRRYLVSLGKQLPASETLTVEVLDIDLAGMSRPVPGRANDLRLLRGQADAPRIMLRYALSDQGRVIKNGKADLFDLAYLDRPVRVNAPERFPYEKRLLANWFQSTFGTSGNTNGR